MTGFQRAISTDSFMPFVQPWAKAKVQVVKERIHDIDPDILVHTYESFYNEETSGMFDFGGFDYVVDAIDTVTSSF